ncbi:hypothetical protein SDJN02_21493, partial [Cucurbita argyrosperma subsp. argyrosperma]
MLTYLKNTIGYTMKIAGCRSNCRQRTASPTLNLDASLRPTESLSYFNHLGSPIERRLHRIDHQLSLTTNGWPFLLRFGALLFNFFNQTREFPHHASLLRKLSRDDMFARYRFPSGRKLIEPRFGTGEEIGLLLIVRLNVPLVPMAVVSMVKFDKKEQWKVATLPSSQNSELPHDKMTPDSFKTGLGNASTVVGSWKSAAKRIERIQYHPTSPKAPRPSRSGFMRISLAMNSESVA